MQIINIDLSICLGYLIGFRNSNYSNKNAAGFMMDLKDLNGMLDEEIK